MDKSSGLPVKGDSSMKKPELRRWCIDLKQKRHHLSDKMKSVQAFKKSEER